MNEFGFLRLTAACLVTSVANTEANGQRIIDLLSQVRDSDIVVFPECCVTGYTCADLFGQTTLLQSAIDATLRIADATKASRQLVVVGLPVAVANSLYNCAAVLYDGQIIGVVPKQFIPNYKEFYESRWFSSADGTEPPEIRFGDDNVPFGIDLLFEAGETVVGIEICEDLWMPIPPSSFQALAGANVLLNLSASNETIGKCAYRKGLVEGQSGRCIAAYAYASAGPSESTTDLVFGGHCLIAENGRLLKESSRVGDGDSDARGDHFVTVDLDVQRLMNERHVTTSFDDCERYQLHNYRRIAFSLRDEMEGLRRNITGTPFVPKEKTELENRCAEIFGIQCAGMAKRVEQLDPSIALNIGVSGGLDSTLALLVAVTMCDMLGQSRQRIHGLTMPGFGTTQKTKDNAINLMRLLGISDETIDIRLLCMQAFESIGHKPFGIDCKGMDVESFQKALHDVAPDRRHDLVFENVQARLRTFLLMSKGFVVGTGDMSEAALGWSTYNGDHMSMYNPNCSIPKTLVRFLVEYVARNRFDGDTQSTLLSIVDTTISPELLPPSAAGEIVQSTEDTIGPYELHDFFLFNVVRNGYSREKILFLADHADFTADFSREQIRQTLNTFYKRFFANQFKRSCVPDGPKVGTVSLSPRGDWRMPSDADPSIWMKDTE